MERYNEYKDSGVQWLGEIPSHWEVCKVKHHYKMITGFTPSTGKSEYYSNNSDNTWVTIADMKTKFISESSSHISDLYIKNFKPTIVPKGSLLYSFKLSVGQVAFADKDLYTNEAISSFENNENVCLGFLFYSASLCIIKNANTNIYGAFILNQELIKNATIVYPPFAEQKAIANYLDTATAKIDEAIAQQQKMIDLLNERKQIIINNAVTKGLNPDAPMKDSGVDYIGLIPEHWVVRRMASLGVFSKGGGISRDNLLEEGEPAILYGDIYTKYNYFAEDIKNHVSKKVALASVEVHKNELLMTGSGETKEDIGKTIVFLGNKAYAGGDVIIFKQDNNNSSFLSYALNSSYAKNFRYKESKGEIVVHIYANAVRQLYLALPDITEQNSIVEYLNNKVGIIDSEICVVRKQISLLQERKQIIINDVVTGKVKVS